MAQPGIIGYRVGDHVYDPADVTVLVRTDWPGLGDEASVVPASVLEALASAWEDQAGLSCKCPAGMTYHAVNCAVAPGQEHAPKLADCARMLREAITHGGQG